MYNLSVILLSFILMLFALFAVQPAGAVTLSSTVTSLAALRTRWLTAKPWHVGEIYAEPSSAKAPYVAGALAPTFLDDGVRMLNFMRCLAGLPADLTLDPEGNVEAQHGAVLLAALGELTHFPTRPEDMPEDFYRPGRAACGSSSISHGCNSLSDAVRDWMVDNGNLPHLGHRRWILSPELQRTALGYCREYSLMKCFGLRESKRPAVPPYTAIPWPASGLFPHELFSPSETWSVLLNPKEFKPSGTETVTVRRVSNGQMWELSQANRDEKGKYLAVNTQGFGVPYCLAFRLPPAEVCIDEGEAYEVTVKGLTTPAGAPATLSWRTEFVSLGAILTGIRIQPSPDKGKRSYTLTFSTDLAIDTLTWRLKSASDRGEGWFFSLGSGTVGPLPPGAHQLTLPISENASVVKPGAGCWIEFVVTDRFTTTEYRRDFTVERITDGWPTG